jgi:hypothetical protein
VLLLATATGPGLSVVGVASRLFDAAPAKYNPLLVAVSGLGEVIEGAIMIFLM